MTNKIDLYYQRLKESPISNGRYEINAPNDSVEIQNILLDLGFVWKAGNTEVIHVPEYKKYLYTQLYKFQVERRTYSESEEKFNGRISFSSDLFENRGGEKVNSITLEELRAMHAELLKDKAIPTTKFDEVW